MKVLVIGFYGKQNLGDDLFVDAFHRIFPELDFIFTDHINSDKELNNVDAVFFGGGSFLDGQPRISDSALQFLLSGNKPFFYIGVGAETDIHPTHQQLLKQAKFIAIRSGDLEKISELNKNIMIIPDLVYSLQDQVIKSNKQKKSVLILPNIYVVPKFEDSHYKHTSWSYFKSEFAQFIDKLLENDYQVNFFPMCQNPTLNDHNASIEIINQLTNRDNNLLLTNVPQTIEEVCYLFSQYKIIITQRFHGIVLANLAGTNHISIYHHIKIKEPDSLYYYGINKTSLLEKFREKINNLPEKSSNINPYIFEGFRTKILLELGKIDGKISGNKK